MSKYFALKTSQHQRKATLLVYKKQILQEIQYSQKKCDDLRSKLMYKSHYDVPDSSDSEDFCLNNIDKDPEDEKLKFKHLMVKTCLLATRELTGLILLRSEANVLVENPQFQGERSITEPGTWRKVKAECRIDLVTFTITFLTHTGLHKFAPTSYRALKLVVMKKLHEKELNNSVLNFLKTPSDAVELIRKYAIAYRSRRTTLANLSSKFQNLLFIEPHFEGGFVLKCPNLLEILWCLENKWSPLRPFCHKLNFNLEFMNKHYVKIIKQAHSELLNSSIQTEDRTVLLDKIITTCLKARQPVDSGSAQNDNSDYE